MKNQFNNVIISAVKNRLTDGELIAPFLGNLLFLGKEAIYRRLRGSVAFTFDEVATISSRLGFSVDSLVGLKQSERVVFDTDLHREVTPEEAYYHILLDYVIFFSELSKSKKVIGRFVNNHLPYVFTIYFETLSKFRYYKWMHQSNGLDSDCLMTDIVVPSTILDLQKRWTEETNRQAFYSIYIYDNKVFRAICHDVDYFYRSNLLNNTELQYIQDELLSLVNRMEETTHKGVGLSGAPIEFYLLPIDLEANYMHFEFDNNVAAYIHIHSINHLRSFDPHVCDLQKDWINQLKQYSVCITQSAERLRGAYFKKQRECILQIGKNR